MNAQLETRAADAGIILSGSLIAVSSDRRPATAGALVDAGHWIHADVIDGRYLGQPGVDIADIHHIAEAHASCLDVHLMVDDLAAAISALPTGLGRITLQSPPLDDVAHLLRAARERAAAVWIALSTLAPESSRFLRDSGADGVLLMLTPPGQAGRKADLSKLAAAASVTAAGLPLGVDGGVNQHCVGDLRDATVSYAVAGRGLLGR
jgi:pentose-5-phosphate-3-epimerase